MKTKLRKFLVSIIESIALEAVLPLYLVLQLYVLESVEHIEREYQDIKLNDKDYVQPNPHSNTYVYI